MDKRQYQTPEVKVVVPPDLMLSIVDESATEVLSKQAEFVDEETEKDETASLTTSIVSGMMKKNKFSLKYR